MSELTAPSQTVSNEMAFFANQISIYIGRLGQWALPDLLLGLVY